MNSYQIQKDSMMKERYISVEKRKKILSKLYKLLKQNESNINQALKLDLNKHPNEVYFSELGIILSDIKYTIKHLNSWTKPQRVHTPLTLFTGKSKIIYEPLGLSLIISPWNYPFNLTFIPLIASIAAGNRAIIKPSEYSIHSSKLITEIINKSFSPEYLYVENTSVENTIELLNNRFDIVFFTGSEKVGTLIAQQVSKFHTPLILELGGKCPVIVDKYYDLKDAAKKIIFGKLINAGQTCVAPDYVCVHEYQINEFIKLCQKEAENVLGRNPLNNDQYPKIINEKQFNRLLKISPNTLLYNPNSQKIAPYIYKATWDDKAMQEEIFGPFLPVIPYHDFKDAVNIVASRNEPLASYLFSKEKKNIEYMNQQLQAGSLIVNDVLSQMISRYLPFGGSGASGNGKYHGFEGFKTFSNAKAFYKRGRYRSSLADYPYTEEKLQSLKKLL